MTEVGRFEKGDLVRFVFPWSERATRLYLVMRFRIHTPGGPVEVECWDPMIRGYSKFWDYELRVVARYADLIHSEFHDVD